MTQQQLNQRQETILRLMDDPMYKPMKLKELAVFLDIPREQREELLKVLTLLVSEGKLQVSEKGRYQKPTTKTLVGSFLAHPKGFGFVRVEGIVKDFYIPEGRSGGALHGDTVRITLYDVSENLHREAFVESIVKRANKTVVGFYKKNKKFGFLLPDNKRLPDIFIAGGDDMGAKSGQKVVAALVDFGNGKGKSPRGEVTEILGYFDAPGVDIESIIKSYGIEESFPEEVLLEAEATDSFVSEKDLEGRRNFRKWLCVTIDDKEAKDLDDAVSLTVEDGVFQLGVHIADVSHYVREHSKLDKEALSRGTSIYPVGRVIPMLPPKLSNGICSLNVGEDRLTLSCIMDIDQQGKVIGHEICKSVIRVSQRLTYEEVSDFFASPSDETFSSLSDCRKMLLSMQCLSHLIRKRRYERGAIDFDFPESRITLDKRQKAVDVVVYERNDATRLIEDFMLLANETVAEDYFWQGLPFLYRVHDAPDPEKMKNLSFFISNLGFNLPSRNREIHPKEIQKLLLRIEGNPAEALISRMTLRNMKKALYSESCRPHFGLASSYYTHFTSPIRRYPDLQIHRIIKENLERGMGEKRIAHYSNILPEVAVLSSEREKIAEEIERDSIRYKKCEYIEKHIGKYFSGVVSSITAYGMYVELDNTVEGFIRLSDLTDDEYYPDPGGYRLVGEESKRTFEPGTRVEIRVKDVDRIARTVDFVLA